MISKEFPLTPTGCRLVQENLDTADFNVVQQIAILSHCQKCSACQTHSQQLTNLRTLLMAQARIQVPNDFDIKLRQKIAASKTLKPISFWQQLAFQPAFGATLAATAIVGIFVGAYYYQQPQTTVANNLGAEINTTPKVSQPYSVTSKQIVVVPENPSSQPKEILQTQPRVRAGADYVASNQTRPIKQPKITSQSSRPITLDEIDVEIQYGNASRTLPLSAVTYGSRPVLKVDNVSTGENRSAGISPEAKIF